VGDPLLVGGLGPGAPRPPLNPALGCVSCSLCECECRVQFLEFDQNEFFYNSPAAKSGMDDVGYIYVPSGCKSGAYGRSTYSWAKI